MTSPFGVQHVEKGLSWGGAGRLRRAAKKAGAVKNVTEQAPVKPDAPIGPTGPGSKRARMSQSAWESQTAAARRNLGKSAFGVEHVEKGLVGEVGAHMLGGGRGFKAGVGGARSAGSLPRSMPSAVKNTTRTGFKTGRFVRRNAKPLAIGGGAGLGAGALAGSQRKY